MQKRSVGRRLADLFQGRPRLQVGALLAGPMGWLVIGYLGSLAVLLVAAFWSVDPLSGLTVKGFTLENFESLVNEPVYRTIIWRTVRIAAAGHRHRRCDRLPDRLLHGEGRQPARQGAPGRRHPAAALVELPGQGLRLADDALRRRRRSTGRWSRSACTAPDTGPPPSGW